MLFDKDEREKHDADLAEKKRLGRETLNGIRFRKITVNGKTTVHLYPEPNHTKPQISKARALARDIPGVVNIFAAGESTYGKTTG